MKKVLLAWLFASLTIGLQAQEQPTLNNFNPHNNDTTQQKEVPRGLYVWTVDRRFGDIRKAEPDTMPHLYQRSVVNTGLTGDYNTTGNTFGPRLSRIFIDRYNDNADQFGFVEPYSYNRQKPDEHHFTNTLSPITNLSYDNCGSGTTGEDHFQAKFATNVGKKIGFGFNINYAYARGFFQNQNISHLGFKLFGSYRGDQYQAHLILSTQRHKASENGGITWDEYITYPEQFSESYATNEIPTVLSRNWNRNKSKHLFLTHRYALGFYRDVMMTEEEIKAREFAKASLQEKEAREAQEAENNDDSLEDGNEQRPRAKSQRPKAKTQEPTGRPDNAKIAGDLPSANSQEPAANSQDTTRVSVASKAQADSLLAVQAREDSLAALMKKEFVAVTSFIHTLELNHYERIHQAYLAPKDYYANQYYSINDDGTYSGDSIFDKTRYLQLKNTLGVALLEGFNKYAKAGLKAFFTHELRRFEMPNTSDKTTAFQQHWTEHNISIGAQLAKTQGRTLHYNLTAETWLAGEDFGQLKVDFSTDLNFPLFGDTVTLAAKAYFHRLNPTFYHRRYHAKHLWWDNNDLNQITRTRVEGLFAYRKTNTRLRVAIEEMQNYTYLGMSYDYTKDGRTNFTAAVRQHTGNINVLTAQLMQDFRLGPVHWDNTVTYQSSSNKDVLPLPALNIFTNLYLKFRIARVLTVELGGCATFFTKYEAPDFCPAFNQFAVQENTASRVTLGGFPFIDAYANLHLKHARFFIMMNNLAPSMGNRMTFLTPHYPLNGSALRFGVSWNFFN